MKWMFTEQFSRYACEGDSIECRVVVGKWATGLRLVATLYRDDDNDAPDERQDGFWPSLDPESAGYIGPKSRATLARHMKRAKHVMQAWRDDEWFYCGVAVRAYFDEIPLTGEFDHALWGVECNYPTFRKRDVPNEYLQTVANEQLNDCANAAIQRLTEIVEAGAMALEAA